MSEASWGAPLKKLDQLWVKVEQRLAVWTVIAEIATLTIWVSMKGVASLYTPGGNVIGLIYRSALTAIILGTVAHFLTRPKKDQPKVPTLKNAGAVIGAVIVGLLLGRAWVSVGVDWTSNAVGWFQNASVLMLIGGPRGVVTRLTLLLALLGASMAASKGKHINIDLATRYFPAAFVGPIAMLGWLVAAMVCIAAAYGFTDSIAVTKFRAEAFKSCTTNPTGICDTGFSSRLGTAAEGMRTDLFLLNRQLALDLHTLPKVLAGDPYDRYMKAGEWNAWVKQGGWEAHFPPNAVASLLLPEDNPGQTKMPAVVEPTTGDGRDLLIRDLNFVLPWGLFVIGLKFLIRILLVISGHVKVDPDAAHDESELVHVHGEEGKA